MDLLSLLIQLFSFLTASFPTAAPVIKILLSVVFGLPAVIQAAILLWHGVVNVVSGLGVLFDALSLIPGLSIVKGIADRLHAMSDWCKAKNAPIEGWESKIVSILDRLSAIKPPSKQV
jgi:hypothetical protein